MLGIYAFDDLTKADAAFVEAEHSKYEQKKGALCNYTPFHYVAKKNEETIGVISGYTCWEEVYIDDLVVREEYRGQGVGKLLMETVELGFANQGFDNINLVTSAFEAPGFYKKCGYELEFVRRNKENPKLDKYFFVKFLDVEK